MPARSLLAITELLRTDSFQSLKKLQMRQAWPAIPTLRPAMIRIKRSLRSLRKEAAIFVMASHGRKGLQGLTVGSETQKVLTHSKIPVLVYR